MQITLITNGSVYGPEPLGHVDILFFGGRIIKVGKIDQKKLFQSGLEIEVIDAKDGIVAPGFIDPHSHLLGGSGENGGFSSQTPEITLTELTQSGVTTVVGTLGADVTMKTMEGLLAKAKGFIEEGLNAFIFTGGYPIPPVTIMDDPRQDIMFIEEVIGMGEVAIADERSNEPQIPILAKNVVDTFMGGMLANKAGVTHFHCGPGYWGMETIWKLLDYGKQIKPEWLYPTHIERSKELVKEAVKLSKKGSFVDMDVAEGDLDKWLKVYISAGGSLDKLTVSSDASKTSPANVINEIVRCVQTKKFKFEDLLPLITRNPATVLKLNNKGVLKDSSESSLVIMDKKTFEFQYVISKGNFMIRERKISRKEKFLEESNRTIHLVGEDA